MMKKALDCSQVIRRLEKYKPPMPAKADGKLFGVSKGISNWQLLVHVFKVATEWDKRPLD